jgi:hypothetical protein
LGGNVLAGWGGAELSQCNDCRVPCDDLREYRVGAFTTPRQDVPEDDSLLSQIPVPAFMGI